MKSNTATRQPHLVSVYGCIVCNYRHVAILFNDSMMGAIKTMTLPLVPPELVRLFGEFDYAARSWPQEYRVILKAEVLVAHDGRPARDNQRYVVTSLKNAIFSAFYQHGYCPRGQAKNWIKQVKTDLTHLGFPLSCQLRTPAAAMKMHSREFMQSSD